MDDQRFWAMIEQAWPSTSQAARLRRRAISGKLAGADEARIADLLDDMLQRLGQALEQLGQADLLAFDRILERKLYELDREEIHRHTDGSDDGFLYCRGFIVGLGQEFYELVSADPARALLDMELEQICYISDYLYRAKFGQPPPSEISRESFSNAAGWSSTDAGMSPAQG